MVVWPSILGGKNWEPMSFNPQNNTAYINTLNFGGHYKAVAADYKAGEWYVGMDLSDLWEWPQGPRGYLKAIDLLTGKTKWEDGSDIPRFSGVLSTGGGLASGGALVVQPWLRRRASTCDSWPGEGENAATAICLRLRRAAARGESQTSCGCWTRGSSRARR